MSVYIIAADDAKALANKLKASLQSSVEDIHTIPIDSFLKSNTIQNEKSVKVIVLTSLSWQEIQRQTKDVVKSLFLNPRDLVVISLCQRSVKSASVKMFSETADDWSSVALFNASGEDWYKAEARIRFRLSEIQNGEFQIPCASRFILKPDSVSTVSESQSEVLIILFADGSPQHYSDVKKVEIQTGDSIMETRKIQANVWSFSAINMTPGDHDIRVLVDNVDIGTNTLQVQDQLLGFKTLLTKIKEDDPKGYLSDILKIDERDFDQDLADFLNSGSSCVSVVEKLLKYGDEDDFEYPNILHFLAKYGHDKCVEWCQRELSNFKVACLVPNKYGKTPAEVAVEAHQNQLLIRTLKINDSDDEDLLPISSPFRQDQMPIPSPFRQGGDSGWSSQGTVDQPSNATQRSSSGIDRPFEFNRVSRPYNTIDDDDSAYNRPWDTRTLFANRSVQAMSFQLLSRSVREDQRESQQGLARANTLPSRNTKM